MTESNFQTRSSTTANFLKAWSFYESDRHNGFCVFSNIQSEDIQEIPALSRLLPQNTILFPAVSARQERHGHSHMPHHSQPTRPGTSRYALSG